MEDACITKEYAELKKEYEEMKKRMKELEELMERYKKIQEKKDDLGYTYLYKIKEDDPELFNTIINNT